MRERGIRDTYDLHDYGEILSYRHYTSLKNYMFRSSAAYNDLLFDLFPLRQTETLNELEDNMYYVTFIMDYQPTNVLPEAVDNYLRADLLQVAFYEQFVQGLSDNILDATVIVGDDVAYDAEGEFYVEFKPATLTLILKDMDNEDLVSDRIANLYAGLSEFGFVIGAAKEKQDASEASPENADSSTETTSESEADQDEE